MAYSRVETVIILMSGRITRHIRIGIAAFVPNMPATKPDDPEKTIREHDEHPYTHATIRSMLNGRFWIKSNQNQQKRQPDIQ